MLKYLILPLSLCTPLQVHNLRNFKATNNTNLVCMAPLGNIPSNAINSAATPNEGCRTTSTSTYHNDGSVTTSTTMTCNKRETIDKNGKVTKATDTSQPKFEAAKKSFFNTESKKASSSKKSTKSTQK